MEHMSLQCVLHALLRDMVYGKRRVIFCCCAFVVSPCIKRAILNYVPFYVGYNHLIRCHIVCGTSYLAPKKTAIITDGNIFVNERKSSRKTDFFGCQMKYLNFDH